MTDRVLVPATSHPPWSRAVAEAVVEFEDREGMQPIVLHVFDADEKHALLESTDNENTSSIDDLAGSKASVAAATETLEDAGFEVEIRGVESESRGDAILETARDENADRMYLFKRKRSPVGKAVHGSSLQRVLSKATIPLVVLPTEIT
ncbi:universal stress protein [Halorussus halophilus]|uniref:universal stress protein n=1 Tax=Halorussus halophilus TaxID=2650975 RepID=UPI001300E69E|nr:universal stress protein [Halorussus halophilus]